MNNFNLNKQIAHLRKKKGITQEELAQALGVTNQSVSKWESAQCCPDVMFIPQIANYFGVTTDELFGTASQDNTERSVWVTELYDSGITAHLIDFSVEKIPAVQKCLKEKDLIVIEDHRIRGGVWTGDNRIYWITSDEVLSFKQGDVEECQKATIRLIEKGINKHLI